ncbi:MAG: hypothetical protein NUW24_05245 [Anaerolineae bacterium]|jgi:hypothetical protein|nr:hypothetical protein [Anaerolineae bacterium]MDH7472999.1 hypothetical protein [Anaerolineae bacterium]
MDEWMEAHLDLLQNIEAAIAAVYRDDPALEDWDVSEALSAVIKRYTSELRGHPFRMPALNEKSRKVFEAVEEVLAMRDGFDTADTTEERLRALKEVRASVRRHSKIHGRRGYLDFIIHFV